MTRPPDTPAPGRAPVREVISPEWRGLLRPGERILWQGAPGNDTAYYQPRNAIQVMGAMFSMFFFAMMILIAALNPIENKTTTLAWLVFGLGTFILAVFGREAFASYKIRHSFYTLTTKRAFVGWTLFGRRLLDSYCLYGHSKIEYQPGNPGSVYFAEKIHKTEDSSWTEKIGFLNIPDAKEVYELLLKARQGTA